MGMLRKLAAFGITRCRLRSALHWFTDRKLFFLNCAVLVLNVLFYLANNVPIPASKVYFMPPLNSSSEVHFMPPLDSSSEGHFMPPLNSSSEVHFMPPLDSSSEVHFMPPLNSYDRALLHLTFQAFTEAMESSNVTYFIFGGTLLGSWRHHDLIPWDDDIDVICNVSDLQTVSRVLRSKVAEDPASFGLYETAMSSEDLAKIWKFYPQNGKLLSHGNYKSPYLDVFFYRENETLIWNASPYFITTEIWLKSDVFPLRRRPFGNLMVPTPCNPEAFLEVTLNVSVCKSRSYNHILEMFMPFKPMKVPCSRLAHLYPFVHRTNTSNEGSAKFVLETLRFRNSTLRRFKARTCC